MRTQKILYITGSSGSLGIDLIQYLKDDFIIIPLRRDDQSNYYSSVNTEKHDESYLLHLSSATPHNTKEPKAYHSNKIALMNAIQYLKDKSSQVNVLFTSGISVYEPMHCIGEVSEINPLKQGIKYKEDYGYSKIKCEKELIRRHHKGVIKSYVTLRLPGILSTNAESKSPNFLVDAVKSLRHNEEIQLYGAETIFNNAIDSQTIAAFIKILIAKEELPNTEINLASLKPIKLKQLFEEIANKLDTKSKITWKETSETGFYISTRLAQAHGYKGLTVSQCVDNYINLSLN